MPNGDDSIGLHTEIVRHVSRHAMARRNTIRSMRRHHIQRLHVTAIGATTCIHARMRHIWRVVHWKISSRRCIAVGGTRCRLWIIMTVLLRSHRTVRHGCDIRVVWVTGHHACCRIRWHVTGTRTSHHLCVITRLNISPVHALARRRPRTVCCRIVIVGRRLAVR